MEFEELKQAWEAQNDRPLYSINEKALAQHIASKKQQALHVTDISELLSVFTNAGAGIFIIVFTWSSPANVFLYLMAAWMIACAAVVVATRARRFRSATQFDRSVRGDLEHAIAVASYQVRLSALLRWNIVPIAALITLSIFEAHKSPWFAVTLLVFFIVVFWLSGLEHNLYKNRKRTLLMLRTKLEAEMDEMTT